MTTAYTHDPSVATRLRWQLQDSLVLARGNFAHVARSPRS